MSDADSTAVRPLLPYAFGGPVCAAKFKQSPLDFVVIERLPFEADGEGPHWLLSIEKNDCNTLDMLDALARALKVARKSLGYSGLKDRFAVTRQFVTVPAQNLDHATVCRAEGKGWRVLSAVSHRRKLRVGSHRENAFVISLRDIPAEPETREALVQKLELLRAHGMPNYFGPQRFGHQGTNVRKARQLFSGVRSLPRQQHRFAISAARSSLFNAVLALRIRQGTWSQLVPGDAVSLQGSASWFPDSRMSDADRSRLDAFDVHPSGPLWGGGELPSTGEARQIEQAALKHARLLTEGLEKQGLKHERRALRQPVSEVSWSFTDNTLELRFVLAKGCFATSALRELVCAEGLELPDFSDVQTPED